jgi:hypothetical protein
MDACQYVSWYESSASSINNGTLKTFFCGSQGQGLIKPLVAAEDKYDIICTLLSRYTLSNTQLTQKGHQDTVCGHELNLKKQLNSITDEHKLYLEQPLSIPLPHNTCLKEVNVIQALNERHNM